MTDVKKNLSNPPTRFTGGPGLATMVSLQWQKLKKNFLQRFAGS